MSNDDIPEVSYYQCRVTGRVVTVTREEIKEARRKSLGYMRSWERTRDAIGIGKLGGVYPAVVEERS